MKTHVASRLAIQLLFVGLVCIAGPSRSAFGVDRYVDASNATPSAPYTNWTTAATTIQGAVDAAGSGDTVLVTNGVYGTGGKAVFNGFVNRIALDKPITVQSVHGPDYTFIEGDGPLGSDAIRCAYVGTNAVLSGFTLAGGCTRTSGDLYKERYAGGAWCENSAIVSNCIFSGCEADASGGAAAYGSYHSCTFSNNMAGAQGGAVAMATLLLDCTITGNHAGFGGGGAWASRSDRCFYTCNTAAERGGALESGFATNSVIRGNTAKGGGGCYAGVACNCTISSNEAEIGGGTEYTRINNCTVVGNLALFEGGGVYGGDVANCIVYHNVSLATTNENAAFRSSDTCIHTCLDPAPAGVGNTNAAPALQSLLVPRLLAVSPCIGAGTNEAWMAAATDIEGDPRLSGTFVDMGADEVVKGAQFGTMNVEILTDSATALAGQPLRFEAHIEGDVAAFEWDWDDGSSTDNRCVVEHAFSHASTYDVILEAENKSGTASATATVVVVESFTAHVSAAGSHNPPFADWAHAATNIQAAIDICIPGGTVLVAEGDYATGSQIMWGAVSNRIAIDRPINVVAAGGVKSTRIVGPGATGGNSLRCAMLCEGALLSGFTLTEGLAGYSQDGLDNLEMAGGGVWSAAGGTVSNCIVTGNAAYRQGGGVMGGTVVASEVSLNSTGYGDGGGIAYAHARDCVISGNTCEGDGGGLGRGSAEGCTLEGNTASTGGGASGSTLEDCILSGNHADDGGGTQQCTVRNCILYGNQAIWGGGDHESELTGCTITGNSAFRGGGVFSWDDDDGFARNCTIVGNQASGSGGGAFGMKVENSIVYYNTATMENDNVDIVDSGSCNFCCTTPNSGGKSNITSAPLLIGFYYPHIGRSSPCINAGINRAWMATGTDMDGNPRIHDGIVDIGADEYSYESLTGDPRPSIICDGTYGVVDVPIRFQANCRGKAYRLYWYWGDGEQSVDCEVWHAFAAPGDYDVVLDVHNLDMIGLTTTTVHIVAGYTNYVSLSGSHTYPYESWATAANNIQTAVDANRYVGGVVLVSNGVYSTGGKTKFHSITNRILVDKPIIVQSLNGPEVTTVQGSGPGSVGEDYAVRCAYLGNRAVLQGFTLADGATDDDELRRILRECGAAAWCESDAQLLQCIVTGCVSYTYGGGAYQGTLRDSLVYGNEGSYGGGGICRGTLWNCTVWDNDDDDAYDCKMVNSIVYNIDGEEYERESLVQYVCTHSDPGGIGVIEEDPDFVDSDNGDYRLVAGSPCIDAGNNALMQSAADFDGIPRPLDGDADSVATVDMGCYEFLSNVGDTDGDGVSDYAEYVADTGILDSNDWFHIFGMDVAAPAGTVWFNSSATRQYSLLWSTNLPEGIWMDVPGQTGIYGNDGLDSLTGSVTNPACFFRVEVEMR